MKDLGKYIELLFPVDFEKNEFIALGIRGDRHAFNRFCINVDEVVENLEKYSLNNHIYISLSTIMGKEIQIRRGSGWATKLKKNRQAESMYRRYCLGFDFDKKDFIDSKRPQHFKTFTKDMGIEYFIEHFKEFVGLDYSFIVDSGHGYHFYILIEGTSDIKRVTDITKRFSKLAGADIINANEAQTLRLLYSFNLKNGITGLQVKIVDGLSEHMRK